MKHIVISRINIPRELDTSKYRQKSWYKDPAWNAERFRLLNEWLRPSIRKQTCQDFTFISLWHDGHDGKLLANEVPINIVRGWDAEDERGFDYEAFRGGWKGKITMDFWKQIRDKTKEYAGEVTLFTNIDCDDALHKNYISNVQDLAKGKEAPYYFDVSFRYIYDLKSGKCGKKGGSPSPMVTTLEKEYQCYPIKYPHSLMLQYVPMPGKKYVDLKAVQTLNDGNIFSRSLGDRVDSINLEKYI